MGDKSLGPLDEFTFLGVVGLCDFPIPGQTHRGDAEWGVGRSTAWVSVFAEQVRVFCRRGATGNHGVALVGA